MNANSDVFAAHRLTESRQLTRPGSFRSASLNLLFVAEGSLTLAFGDFSEEVLLAAFFAEGSVTLTPQASCTYVLVRLNPASVLALAGCEALFRAPMTDFPDWARQELIRELLEMARLAGGRDAATALRPAASVCLDAAAPSRPDAAMALRPAASVCLDDAAPSRLAAAACALRLLETLRRVTEPLEELPAPLVPLMARRAALYRKIMTCIRDEGPDSLTQSGCAARFGITPQYLGRFLKETRGLTFRACLAEEEARRRAILRRAAQAGGVDEPAPGIPAGVADIPAPGAPCSRPRIDAPHNFGAVGMQPASYGAETQTIGPLPFTADGSRLHSIRVRLDPRRPAPSCWRTLINLGYAESLRSLDMDAALRLVQSEVGFVCGRICRITDLITTSTVQGRSFYDFSAVFSLLDSLIARGITPFLELGNKQFLVQETTTISYAPVSATDTKEYYQQLLSILPDFARACINHYGQDCFDGWYFEISYMYTDDEARERFGLVQYASMFRRIYAVLRGFSKSCRIGGPGFNDWSDPAKIRQMIRLLKAADRSPDFFSAYVYPVEIDPDGGLFLSGDPDAGIRRIRTFAGIVREEAPDSEVWITEFNSNLSSRNYLNDAPYQAACIARMILGSLDLRVEALGYYLLSDAPLRYLDSLDFLFGGWGLLTDHGLPKPSFHAYRMMAMLGHYLIRADERCLITANSRGSFRILLVRCQHPARDYLRRNVEKEDLALPGAPVFENAAPDRCEITVEQALKGTYLVRDYRIRDMHADLFSAWRELDFLYPPNAGVLEELRLRSALLPTSSVRRLAEGEPFSITLTLAPTDLRLIAVDLCASHT